MKNKDHVSKNSRRWKSLYGNKRLNIPPLDWGERTNEDVKVINRWSCQRGKKAVGGSSPLLYTMPLFPMTLTSHSVINGPALQNLHFFPDGSHTILGNFQVLLSLLRHHRIGLCTCAAARVLRDEHPRRCGGKFFNSFRECEPSVE